jgi:DNA-binding MarR family transcriptional regulator
VTSRSLVAAPTPAGELHAVDGLAQLSFLIQNTLARRAAQQGLSLIQTRLLGVVRDRRPTMNELAKLLELDKSSVTGLVARAERRGLVERAPSVADRRAVLVGLTDQGRSLASRVSTLFEADVATIVSCLSPSESDALSELVGKVLVAHATNQGVDLFATLDPEVPPPS